MSQKRPEPLDAPDVLAEGFFHTSTRLQLTLKTHRSKCEHMQRSGRKLWYCRSPETRPRHWNKSLQAQVGLMWCLGPMLTPAEEWVIPTASWRESFPAGTRKIPSTTAGSHYSPGAIFCHPRQQVKQCPWMTLLTAVWEVIPCPSFWLQSFANSDTYSAFLLPILLTFIAPRAIPGSPEFRKDGRFLVSNAESSGKVQFFTIL